MKFLLVLSLTFCALACRAQHPVWEREIPISPTWNLSISPVFPDGKGGGVILLTINNVGFTRAVWLNSTGGILITNDAETLSVLRVTSKTLDLHTATETRRFQAKDLGGSSAVFLQAADATYEAEKLATLVSPTADKRGFFTTQLSSSNLLVRRYSF